MQYIPEVNDEDLSVLPELASGKTCLHAAAHLLRCAKLQVG